VGQITISFFDNACFLLKTPETNILVDPGLSKKQLDEIDYDYVVVSHGHSDHAMNLSSVKVPIHSNKYVAKFKSTDVVIEGGREFKLGDVMITPVATFNHPNLLQRNALYDAVMYPISKVRRCGDNYGFIFQTCGYTIYYTSDTMYDKYLFDNIESQYNPDVILYNAERSLPLVPRSIMGLEEAEQLRWSFPGKIIGMHTPLSARTVREISLD